jgi:hypothetical protein
MDVTRRRFLIAASLTALSTVATSAWAEGAAWASPDSQFAVTHTDAEWRNLLTPSQYNVLRKAGTEAPYSSPLNDEHRRGVFSCAGCALHLYSSDTKFDSGTGWPSFWKARVVGFQLGSRDVQPPSTPILKRTLDDPAARSFQARSTLSTRRPNVFELVTAVTASGAVHQ